MKYECAIQWIEQPPSAFKKRNLEFLSGVAGVSYSIVSKFSLSLWVYLLCHDSRPGSFYVSPECQKSPWALIHLPCKTAVWLQESWIIKEKTWWLSLQAQQGTHTPEVENTGVDYEEGVTEVSGWRNDPKSEQFQIQIHGRFESNAVSWKKALFCTISSIWRFLPVYCFQSCIICKLVGNILLTFWQLLIELNSKTGGDRNSPALVYSLWKGEKGGLAIWFMNKIILRCFLCWVYYNLLFSAKDSNGNCMSYLI